MFGRRKTPVNQAPPPPSPPRPWEPAEKMDRALEAAIRLYTEAFRTAGGDCMALGLPGAPPSGVAGLLADCVVYNDGREFLTLGVTRDFEAFSYQPHCQLYLMINAALILEDLPPSPLRNEIAIAQVGAPLIHAQLMRRWITSIRPAGDALKAGQTALSALASRMLADLQSVAEQTPPWLAAKVDLNDCLDQWRGGFPGAIGRPLDPNIQRMNGLPVTKFIETLLTDFLVETQMRGLQGRQSAAANG